MGLLAPVVVGLGLAGAGALLVSRSRVSGSLPGRFVGKLRRGELYRLWLRAEPAFAAHIAQEGGQREGLREVERRIAAVGFSPCLLVTQDPTDLTVLTAIVRWTGGAEASAPEGLRLLDLQDVTEPPEEAMAPHPEASADLDVGLSWDEEAAIRYALGKDEDPKHLSGFAAQLEPDHPIASSLLRSKAKLSEASFIRTSEEEATLRQAASGERRRRAFASVGWTPSGPEPGEDVLLRLRAATPFLDGKGPWDRYQRAAPGLLPSLASQALTAVGLRYAKDADPDARAGAISLAAPLGEALPHPTLRTLYRFLPGTTLGDRVRALEALRGEGARYACLGQIAKNLEPMGVAVPLLKGALGKILEQGALVAKEPSELATLLGIPEPVAHAALACVIDLPGDVRIVDAGALRTLDPSNSARGTPMALAARQEGRVDATAGAFVSSTALQLAHSAARPTLSNVARVPVARLRIANVLRDNSDEARRAKKALDRAERLLQRRKWVEWYARILKAGGTPQPRFSTGRIEG